MQQVGEGAGAVEVLESAFNGAHGGLLASIKFGFRRLAHPRKASYNRARPQSSLALVETRFDDREIIVQLLRTSEKSHVREDVIHYVSCTVIGGGEVIHAPWQIPQSLLFAPDLEHTVAED